MAVRKPTKALVFELNDVLVNKVSENVSEDLQIDYDVLIKERILCAQKNHDFQEVLKRIIKTATSESRNKEYLLDLYAQELVFHLIQVKGVDQLLHIESGNPINRAINHMEENYRDPITIKEISSGLNMSETNFCRYFKKVTGMNPKVYLTNIKLEKAKSIITKTSVADAASYLGYENVSYFINLFKSKYGLTPKQYQLNADKNK